MKKNQTSYDEMVGNRYGRLLVTATFKVKGLRETRMVCVCDCGKTIVPKASNVVRGVTQSCGCLSRDKGHKTRGCHGLSTTRLYRIWNGMMSRCNNPKSAVYGYYGGRGITVCEEWKRDFVLFKNWSEASGYSHNLEIDRINNNSGYSPDNCKWSTREEQIKNRRCTLYVDLGGVKTTLSDACRITGTRYGKALYRVKSNVANQQIFNQGIAKKRKSGTVVTHNWRKPL